MGRINYRKAGVSGNDDRDANCSANTGVDEQSEVCLAARL